MWNDFVIEIKRVLNEKTEPEALSNNPLVLYGAGGFGSGALQILLDNGIKPIAVCDSSKGLQGTSFHDYTVLSFEEVLKGYEHFDVLIASAKYYVDIKNYILNFISKDRIVEFNFYNCNEKNAFQELFFANLPRFENVYNCLNDVESKRVFLNVLKGRLTGKASYFAEVFSPDQYFNEVTRVAPGERFIDGGAFNGDTLIEFSKICDNQFEAVYCFEPSEKSFEEIKTIKLKHFGEDERIHLLNYGLFDRSGIVSFDDSIGNGGDRIVEDGSVQSIEVVKIDEVIQGKISFIKLDVEGSELKALIGGEKTIVAYKPKLAVCVYHKIEDLLEIPEHLIGLNLNYKFYLRHHGVSPGIMNETVFYAV